LITSDISRSAAESFAMAMDVLPNVKIAGTNTLGILSGMLGKTIGDFYTTLSHQRLLNPDNEFFEVTGIDPDIQMEIFPPGNTFNGHMSAVRKLETIILNEHNRAK